MAVSKMKKLTVVALERDSGSLIRSLLWLRCAEITKTRYETDDAETADAKADAASAMPEAYQAKRAVYETRRADYERDAGILETALSLVVKYRTDKKGLFAKRITMNRDSFENYGESYKAAVSDAQRIIDIRTRRTEIKNQINKIDSSILSLSGWLSYPMPLDISGTQAATLTLGAFPPGVDVEAARADAAQNIPEAEIVKTSADGGGTYVACVAHKSCDEQLQTLLVKYGFLRLSFKELCTEGLDNTPEAITERLEAQKASLLSEDASLYSEIKDIAANAQRMETAYDIAKTDALEAQSQSYMYTTDSAVLMTAWVPMRAEEKVSAMLDKFADGRVCYEFSDPEEGEEPPVLLINRPVAAPFESVVGLYSLPAYGTFDPTFIMSVFYFIIFGFMLGDFVYGLLLTVGGLLAIKFLDLGDGIKRLVKLFAICGVSCMICGILFGSYLGDLPSAFMSNMLGVSIKPLYLWFDMVADPVTFLIVSFVIGAAHLFCGMGIQFYVLCKEGRPFDAIFDVGSWFVVFAGLILLLVNTTAAAVVAGIGVLMLIATQGRAEKNPIMKVLKGIMSLYDIVSYMSDLLSYSRIMALGLASAVIAQVVNLFATMGGPSIMGWIMLPIIVILGHVINLAINLLGTFVHTSRLQYIEFFGKFFKDGGRPFKPAAPVVKYTNITDIE